MNNIYDYFENKNYTPKTIVEVGSATGIDTLKMYNTWQAEEIIAYEPYGPNFQVLQKACENYPRIKCYQVAVSNKTGEQPFYFQKTPSRYGNTESSSLLPPLQHARDFPEVEFEETFVPCCILWDFIERKDRDLLWLDTQGSEYQILETINSEFKYVYTEFNNQEAYAGQRNLTDLIELMKSKKYSVAKVFEWDVLFRLDFRRKI